MFPLPGRSCEKKRAAQEVFHMEKICGIIFFDV
jgi:hypothetical protein